MKKILLTCCLLAGIVTVSLAQGGRNFDPEQRAKQLKKQLSLTDEQTTKITAIYKEQMTKMDSIRNAGNGDRQAMRGAMMPLMTATNDKVKAVLTAEQAEAYEKMQRERMERMRQGGGGGGAPQD